MHISRAIHIRQQHSHLHSTFSIFPRRFPQASSPSVPLDHSLLVIRSISAVPLCLEAVRACEKEISSSESVLLVLLVGEAFAPTVAFIGAIGCCIAIHVIQLVNISLRTVKSYYDLSFTCESTTVTREFPCIRKSTCSFPRTTSRNCNAEALMTAPRMAARSPSLAGVRNTRFSALSRSVRAIFENTKLRNLSASSLQIARQRTRVSLISVVVGPGF